MRGQRKAPLIAAWGTRAEAEKLQERLDRLEEAVGGAQAPQQADFDDYDQYIAAMSAHSAAIHMDKREQDAIKAEQEKYTKEADDLRTKTAEERNASLIEQFDDAKTRYADFEQVALDSTVPVTKGMVDIMAATDSAGDLAYYFGSNRQEAARIAGLEPIEAAVEIGRIEARLSRPQPNTTTSAPEPVTPVSPKSSVRKNPADMSMDEYRKWRMGA